VYCEIVEAELAIRDQTPTNQRVLFETAHFLAVQPYSSIYPFETWLIPKRHDPSFAELTTQVQGDGAGDKTELEDLASLINDVLGRLYACLDDPAYNLILKTAPAARSDEANKYASFHWHIRIEPRGITTPGGYELSTGIFSSPTPPEETTTFLQDWGILGQADAHLDGTLAWYLRMSEMATKRELVNGLQAVARKSSDGSVQTFLDLFEHLRKELPPSVDQNSLKLPKDDKPLHLAPFDRVLENLAGLLCEISAHAEKSKLCDEDIENLARILREKHAHAEKAKLCDNDLENLERLLREIRAHAEKTEFCDENIENLERLLNEIREHAGETELSNEDLKNLANLLKDIYLRAEKARLFDKDLKNLAMAKLCDVNLNNFVEKFCEIHAHTEKAKLFDNGLESIASLLRELDAHAEKAKLCARTILSALKYAPIKLRNIINILGRSTRGIRGFAGAEAWCRERECSDPDMFLTQSQPPPESKQRLQSTALAGGYDGPHYRRCPATGRWVLIPSEARRKSTEKLKEDQEKKTGPVYLPRDSKQTCSFCNADKRKKNKLRLAVVNTDQNVWEVKYEATWDDEDIAKWGSYVINSINPLLREPKQRVYPLISGIGPFESIAGQGISDVIVIGGTACLWKKNGCHNYVKYMSVEHLRNALRALCKRINRIKHPKSADPSLAGLYHLTVFSNHRTEAGARVSHVNWQLIATPIVPTGVQRELEHGRRYAKEYCGRSCFCDMIQAEEEHAKLVEDEENKARIRRGEMLGARIISPQDSPFVVLAPYASRSPFEVWIMPRVHAMSIEQTLNEDKKDKDKDKDKEKEDKKTGETTNATEKSPIEELAETLSKILQKLHEKLGDPAYSMLIQNAPVPKKGDEHLYRHYHWRIIIETQRLAIPAGYEHLTGIWSNVVAPEEAAKVLRAQYTETTGK
jgi:galactose-1-phosphate uridylyltransferase